MESFRNPQHQKNGYFQFYTSRNLLLIMFIKKIFPADSDSLNGKIITDFVETGCQYLHNALTSLHAVEFSTLIRCRNFDADFSTLFWRPIKVVETSTSNVEVSTSKYFYVFQRFFDVEITRWKLTLNYKYKGIRKCANLSCSASLIHLAKFSRPCLWPFASSCFDRRY